MASSSISPTVNSGTMCSGLKRFFFTYKPLEAIKVFIYDDDDGGGGDNSHLFKPRLYRSFTILDYPFDKLKLVFAVRWSPLGSYLLYIGSDELPVLPNDLTSQIITYPTDSCRVAGALISPLERFLYCVYGSHRDRNVDIRDLKTGQIVKSFEVSLNRLGGVRCTDMDYLKFDFADNNCAYLDGKRELLILETKTFSARMRFQHVFEMSWSPTASVLTMFGEIRENGDRYSCMRAVNCYTDQVFYQRRFQGLYRGSFYWHSSGDYMACLCRERSTSYYTTIVLLGMKSSTSAMFSPAYKIGGFAWGSNRNLCAIIRYTDQNEMPTAVDFHSVHDSTGELTLEPVTTVDVLAHVLHWSPTGRHIVMQSHSWQLTFYDVDLHKILCTVKDNPRPEPPFRWDSSGRYFYTRADGYVERVTIWSSSGERVANFGQHGVSLDWSNRLSPLDPTYMIFEGMSMEHVAGKRRVKKKENKYGVMEVGAGKIQKKIGDHTSNRLNLLSPLGPPPECEVRKHNLRVKMRKAKARTCDDLTTTMDSISMDPVPTHMAQLKLVHGCESAIAQGSPLDTAP